VDLEEQRRLLRKVMGPEGAVSPHTWMDGWTLRTKHEVHFKKKRRSICNCFYRFALVTVRYVFVLQKACSSVYAQLRPDSTVDPHASDTTTPHPNVYLAGMYRFLIKINIH
jgi:hypothetical protein